MSGLHGSGEEYADPNGWRITPKARALVPTSNRQIANDYPNRESPRHRQNCATWARQRSAVFREQLCVWWERADARKGFALFVSFHSLVLATFTCTYTASGTKECKLK